MSPAGLLAILLMIIPSGAKAPARETRVELQISPMPAPRPALRYLLMPELKEATPGNPIAAYLNCAVEKDLSDSREIVDKAVLRQVDRAARMDRPDWQILEKIRIENFGLLTTDLNKIRYLADKIAERARAEIAESRFDDAVVSIQTLLAMACHMNGHPMLIVNMTGLQLATQAMGLIEDWIAQPNSPNLYWALTNIHQPLVHCETGIQGERLMMDSVLRKFIDHQQPMKASEARKRLEGLLVGLSRADDLPQEEIEAWRKTRFQDLSWRLQACMRLVDYGIPEERLTNFPIEQIILLDELREYETQRDEGMKCLKLPPWQVEEQLSKIPQPKDKLLFGTMQTAYRNMFRGQARVEQRFALMRHIEAIRLHAADHGGHLPEKLEDLAVPLPCDPFTGKPFRYWVSGEIAHLRAMPPASAADRAEFNRHYEISIRK